MAFYRRTLHAQFSTTHRKNMASFTINGHERATAAPPRPRRLRSAPALPALSARRAADAPLSDKISIRYLPECFRSGYGKAKIFGYI
ncbi:hypothetical protein EVAR_96657_1 [Eumeta japonica]|uniref:Uncharacterized protein n=1 Tax=Eumeta variegata TaxID=151549 RepID=A0A4C2A5G9_EUMVA|nr:hypothetical protein EVAR_96657_1 [Eumeta japonica]